MAAAPRSPKQDFFGTFHQLASKVLTPAERSELHRKLEVYHDNHDVTAFVRDTSFLWSSPKKLQLLPFVRKLMAERDRPRFDALLGVHEGLVVEGRSRASSRHEKTSSLSSSRSGSHPLGRQGGIHVIKVYNPDGASPRMGFSIRGGSEFGLGVYVSQVEPGSPAEASGLRCGDQILEANGIDLENATGVRAAELLGSTLTPTLIVRRTRKVPEWKVTKERILWYDVALKKLVVLPSGEVTSVKRPGAQRTEVTERRVVLKLLKKTDFIGLNVRGGREYGLGIYVSRVDKGGLAEQAGIQVGDQLVQVNGHHLDDVTHPSAVELLRSSKQLIITAWAIGRFPAYKELFSEYVWSDSGDRRGDHLVHTAELHPEPAARRKAPTQQVTHRTRTRETRVDRGRASRSSRYDSGIVLNGLDSLHIGDDPAIDYDDEEEDDDYDHLHILRPELFYPRDKDIIFRGNYTENWRQLDTFYGEETTSAFSAGADRRNTHNYRPRASIATLNSDSDSSDMDMDYTTFLERKMRRDEGRPATSSVISSEGNLYSERGNAYTDRTNAYAERGDVSKVTREIAVGSDAGQNDVYAVVHKPPRAGQRQGAQKTDHTQAEAYTSQRTDSGVYAIVQPQHSDVKQNSVKVVQSDVQAVNTQQSSSEQRQDYHSREQSISGTLPHSAPHRTDTGAQGVVLDKAATARNSTSDYYSHSAHDNSNSSRSSSDQGSMAVSKPHHKHHKHRTHVYHINASPDSEDRNSGSTLRSSALQPSFSTFRGNDSTSGLHNGSTTHKDNVDDDYTVVTEVLDEMTTSFGADDARSPPEIALLPGDELDTASESSRSASPVTTPTLTGISGVPSNEQTTLDLLNAEIKRLELRQSSLGSREISSLGNPPDRAMPNSDNKAGPEPEKKLGTWTNLKKKLTGSFRVKKNKKREPVPSAESFSMGSIRKKGVFERTFGSQMMNQHTVDKYNMMMVEERARQLLNKDECVAVLKHIKTYHDNKQLERLVELLLTILDRPEKLQLLKDIRGVIYPYHMGHFDSLVARHEVTAYEKLSTKLHLPLSPVHRSDSCSKPRTKLMTTVLDADGHFHIKTIEQHDHDTHVQKDVVTTLQRSKGRSFDSAPATTTTNIYNGNIYTSSNDNDNSSKKDTVAPTHVVPPPIEWRDDIEVIIVEKEPQPPPPPPPPAQPVEEGMPVYVSKQKKHLGLIVSGGAGDHMDPSVRIDLVMPWGAAADDDRIKSGMHILSVDDQSLKGMTQSEAIAVLKRCFQDKRSVNMKLVLKQP